MTARGILRLGLLAAAIGGLAAPARASDVDLDDLAGRRLPWRAAIDTRSDGLAALDEGWVRPVLSTVCAGDSLFFIAHNPGIVMTRIRDGHHLIVWQHNLEDAYCGRTPCASLEGTWDADGDGDLDLVITARARDGSRWLLRGLDLAEGRVVAEAVLAAGQDRRGDGSWDGTYAALGVETVPGPGGPRRAFLVAATAGFDLAPRGILAVDTRSGDILWTHLTGAKPLPGRIVCTDLDGDGALEVAYLGPAVDNLKGEKINGLSDDVCHLVAIETDGSRLWTRSYPDAAGGGWISAFRRRGSPGAELVTAIAGRHKGSGAIEVLDGRDGRVVATTGLTAFPRGLESWADDEGVDIYVGVTAVGIVHLRFDGELREQDVARATRQPYVQGIADFLPTPGPEVLVATQPCGVIVLSRDLKPLACFEDPQASGGPVDLLPVPIPSGAPSLVVLGGFGLEGLRLVFQPSPRSVPWGALVLAPAAVGGAWYARRRRRGASAATRRELRLQLLARLELSNHGAIGALRSLRRLVWILDARAQAGGAVPDLDRRLHDLVQECRTHMLPDLAGVLELAGLSGCQGGSLGQARSAHDRITKRLGSGGEPDDDTDLRAAAASLDQALQDLRHEIEGEFRADLAEVAARVLAAHAEGLQAAGAVVTTSGLDRPVWCRIDPEELVFVLDNLVGNALRAMAGSARRELALAQVRDGSGILLTVHDTGCGIPPEDWEMVMTTRASTRDGGGLGLPASRQLLRKYGGNLVIAASEAGMGTTFMMNVAPARAQESVESP